MNAYRRRKLERAGVVVSHRMAANGLAVTCGCTIAWVSLARRYVAYATAACGAGLFVAGDGRARQTGKLERYFGCRFAQTPAQQRGVATFFVSRIVSGERRVSARRSYQPDDPDCGWHDRQRARQDGQPMEDSLQCQTAEFGV